MSPLPLCVRKSGAGSPAAFAHWINQSRFGLLLLTIAAAFAPSAGGQTSLPHYTIEDRGPSFVRTLVNTPGLNAKGDFAIWRASEPGVTQGVVITGTGSTKLVGTAEYPIVYPADLNNNDVIVGSLQSTQDLRFTQAFKWSAGKLDTLPTLGGQYASATAINRSNDITGSSQTEDKKLHAALWSGDRVHDLGLAPGGDYSSAHDINDAGVIVGEANNAVGGKPLAFLWSHETLQLLPKLPKGSLCSAQALNSRSEVVGFCDTTAGFAEAVLWKGDSVRPLGTLGDDDATSTALDINASTQIVGSSEIADGKQRAFVWQNGHMFNLNKCVPQNSGWLLLVASRINDNGEIAGRGFYKGAIHSFLLKPAQPSGHNRKPARTRAQ